MERHIRGLEDHETQERKRLHRDVRSPSQRLADTLKLGHVQTGGIFAAGVCLFLFPALATPLFLIGMILFAARCACVSKERLPFRMPLGLSGTDKGDPLPGRRGFAKPEGVFFLGNRLQDRHELWLKAKDILTHCLLFGTTGSGKTETLVSLSYNALATASGLFYIDPKASPKLAVQIWQMARFLGRDDDFRVLNYGTSGKVKGKSPRRLSNTNNPFTFGSAEALTQLLISLMPASDGANTSSRTRRKHSFPESCMHWWICATKDCSNSPPASSATRWHWKNVSLWLCTQNWMKNPALPFRQPSERPAGSPDGK